jgi:hypothetical protein
MRKLIHSSFIVYSQVKIHRATFEIYSNEQNRSQIRHEDHGYFTMDLGRPAVPTQMIILPIDKSFDTNDTKLDSRQHWASVIAIFKQSPGFQRLYWGRHVEEPNKVQLHITRSSLHEHYAFLGSKAWLEEIPELLSPMLTDGSRVSDFTVRHAMLSENTPRAKALGRGAPVTGTAIYLITDRNAWESAWLLWSTIVPNVPGCLGVAGGWVLEPVDGHEGGCFVAWVGWENVKVHDAYHHTADFRKKSIILSEANKGWREYGHVAFSQRAEKEMSSKI